MGDKLDSLLQALPEPALDHPLDQLEPLVWRRIERTRGQNGLNAMGMRLQLAVAVACLCLGVALGWSQTSAAPMKQETPLLMTHSELALVTELGGAR